MRLRFTIRDLQTQTVQPLPEIARFGANTAILAALN
jgi:hypothetical protein